MIFSGLTIIIGGYFKYHGYDGI